MPPLERSYSASIQTDITSVLDYPVFHKPLTKSEKPSNIDLREVAVQAQRDLVFKTNPLFDYNIDRNRIQETSEQDWVDLFTNLCTCQPSAVFSQERPHKKVALATKKNIMYPVARYPDRLNSPQLVERRRKSLEKHLTFRPVIE